MTAKAHGRILFWEGASLWIFSASPGARYQKTDPHSHHAVQITLALTGRVDFDSAGEQIGGVAIAIAPDSLHAFEGTGLVAHLFVAPDGQVGRKLVRQLFSQGSIASIPLDDLGDLRPVLPPLELLDDELLDHEELPVVVVHWREAS